LLKKQTVSKNIATFLFTFLQQAKSLWIFHDQAFILFYIALCSLDLSQIFCIIGIVQSGPNCITFNLQPKEQINSDHRGRELLEVNQRFDV
jgi:hypothetical protein